jgi:hypothetical protein
VLALGGSSGPAPGRFVLIRGTSAVSGKTEIPLKTWHHVVLVRGDRRVAVYLDGESKPEITADLDSGAVAANGNFSFGGRSTVVDRLEGKIDEIAVYDRSLTCDEIAEHFRAATNAPRNSNRQ